MIRLAILVTLLFTSSIAWANSTEPCNCESIAKEISSKETTMKSLMLYADWAVNFHDVIINATKDVLKSKELSKLDRQALKNAQSSASKTKGKILAIKSKIAKMRKMTKKQYGSFILEITSVSYAGTKATSMFFKKKPPRGIGDCGDDYIKPDCSSEASIVGSACSNGVQIMADCGFYSENGGASAMQDAYAACGMNQQSVMQICIAAVNSCQNYSGSMANRNFEADAYSTCSQFQNDKLNMDPGQTETSTGR